MRLRFHWRLLEGGEAETSSTGTLRHDSAKAKPDLRAQVAFCRDAEALGIDSLLVDINFAKPDPMVLASSLARFTTSIQFMVACRPGLISPTLFAQQVNTLAALSNGRVNLNLVSGHSPAELASYGDHLDHDARYARMDEFLAICSGLWAGEKPVNFDGTYYTIREGRINIPFVSSRRNRPEVFVGGNSLACRSVALRHADCWVRFPMAPDALAREIRPVLEAGKEVGLRMAIIARTTRTEAIEAARDLVPDGSDPKTLDERAFVSATDSDSIRSVHEASIDQEWLTSNLWTGAVRRYGAPSVALVGSDDEVASALIDLGHQGVSQFILSGWPKWGELVRFGREVLPRVRAMEERVSGDSRR